MSATREAAPAPAVLSNSERGQPLDADATLLIVTHVHVRRFEGTDYIQGGFGRHVDAFAGRFREVILLTSFEETDTYPEDYRLRAANIRIEPLRPAPWRTGRLMRYLTQGRMALQALWKLPRLAREADVVHPRIPSLVGTAAGLYLRLSRKVTFFYVAGDWEQALLSRGDGLALRALARTLQRTFEFVAKNRLAFVAGETLARKFGYPSDDVVPVNPTSLDRDNVLPTDVVVKRVRRPPRQVLFVGTIWKMKGVAVFLEAVKDLRERGVDLRARLIGSADDSGAWLAEEIESRGLDEVVTLTPHMAWDELLAEYDRGDVFVMPSLEGRGETGPKTVLEAMARGVPLVASRVGFVPRVVRHMENGWIVDPGSVEQVVEAVAELWTNVELRERFAAAGVATAAEYDLDGLMDRVLSLLLQRHPELC